MNVKDVVDMAESKWYNFKFEKNTYESQKKFKEWEDFLKQEVELK